MSQTKRCHWLNLNKPDYVAYHDEEWGVPVYEDRKLFEFLTLESAQAGLSWYTILQRREAYRIGFADYEVETVARYTEQDIDCLMQADSGVIRNRAKLNAAVNNAQRFLEVVEEFGSFAKFNWSFTDGKPLIRKPGDGDEHLATHPVSDAFSKALKKRGFKFVGPTICYAHMQAAGMIIDHDHDCYRREEILVSL